MLPSILTYGSTCLPNICTAMHLRVLQYPIKFSAIVSPTYRAVVKLSRGFPLQYPLHYHLLIALAFEIDAGAKLSRGFPLQYLLLIALAFERGAVAKLSRHNQAHHLSVKQLGRVDSQFVSPVESKSGLEHTGSTPSPLPCNPYFGGIDIRSTRYVLSRTRSEVITNTTLRNNF